MKEEAMPELPPLPEPFKVLLGPLPMFTAEQMRAYAREAVKAERERAAKVCEAEIARAEALVAVEDAGRPVFDREQTEAGICALRTVAAAIRAGQRVGG